MKRLLLLLTVMMFCSSALQAQGVILSQENANDKGITPLWPRCDRSRLSPIKCFDQNLRDHIIRNFQYPENAVSEGLSGTVTVEFIIDKKGKVEILEVQGGHRYLQREAIRLIRAIPKMEPAKWGEKPISVAYEVPITFVKPQ
ncbi:energy transducer TonB [Aquimarina brevivitae]|uniref:TonB family protein n=1 Tax=Aquimarina brevivitae TaxID=323412 RepID=A0A4Q7NY86_9FLAO|nr:energy transducer TonB [Aquimarina brevivitae]RZS92275.1 TonB family protein [Aquimarina brevivitae]